MEKKNTIRRNVKDSYQAQVESFLLARIESDAWLVGAKIPSERELAAELEVSRTTIRNAVLALTARGLFERSVGQGTFVRRKPAPRLEPRTSTGTLGYVVCKEKAARHPIASEAFYFDVFLGIEGETARSGRHTLFSYLDDYDAEEVQAFRTFLEKVDGIIVEEARNPKLLELVMTSRVPAVLLAPTETLEGLDLVTMDLAAWGAEGGPLPARAGTRARGDRQRPAAARIARIRYLAWKEAMEETGLVADERLVDGDQDWSAEAGHAAMGRLLERSPDLTAVFCANDLLAIGALSALPGALHRRARET